MAENLTEHQNLSDSRIDSLIEMFGNWLLAAKRGVSSFRIDRADLSDLRAALQEVRNRRDAEDYDSELGERG